MRNYNKTVRLKPDEYKSISNMKAFSSTWIPNNGIVITKDGNNFPIRTAYTIDDDCEIMYISNSSRRNYYMFLKYYIITLQILAIIATIIEIEVMGHYLVKGSQAENLILPFIGTWLTFNIVVLRNIHTITKWIITIFSYLVLFINTFKFITYLVEILG